MAFSSTDLDNIETAIVEIATRGAAEVEINGRRLRYTKLSELLKLRDVVQSELNGATYGGSLAVRFDGASG